MRARVRGRPRLGPDAVDGEHGTAPVEDRLDAADDVIVNTGTLQDLQQFVQTLHRNYMLLAERIRGRRALGRSYRLVKGRWWSSFAVLALAVVIGAFATSGIVAAFAWQIVRQPRCSPWSDAAGAPNRSQ